MVFMWNRWCWHWGCTVVFKNRCTKLRQFWVDRSWNSAILWWTGHETPPNLGEPVTKLRQIWATGHGISAGLPDHLSKVPGCRAESSCKECRKWVGVAEAELCSGEPGSLARQRDQQSPITNQQRSSKLTAMWLFPFPNQPGEWPAASPALGVSLIRWRGKGKNGSGG